MSVNRYNSMTGELEKIAGGTLYADAPIGTISPFGGSVIPSGYLLCDGTEVLKTAYAELYAVIGDAFGTASDNTKFVLPDLREATTKGVGLSGKSENHYSETGVVLGEFIEDRLQSHTHGIRNGFDGADPDSAERGDGRHGYSAKSNDASGRTGNTTEVKAVGVNYIIKAKHTPIPTDFASSMIGYLGQETNYNLYPWSHLKPEDGADINQDITIEKDGWYSIDYTLSSNADTANTFTFRDFDSQGDVHTIMRAYYDKSGTFRQTFLVPLKAGTYRYSHGGVGTLSVYMNRRDFA